MLIQSSIDKIVGFIAPNICIGCGIEGYILCSSCIANYHEPIQPRCAGCRKLMQDFVVCKSCKTWLPLKSIYISSGFEGVGERLVKSLKFEYKRQASESIAQIMSLTLPGDLDKRDLIICPIPTAPARIRERSFDHALLIANQLSKILDIPILNLLERRTNARQLGSSRKARIDQMTKEFLIKKHSVLPKRVLLIDDVMTTGATLSAATKILKNVGVKEVSALIFAQKL